MVGRPVAPFLGQFDARDSRLAMGKGGLQISRSRGQQGQLAELSGIGLGFGRGVYIGGIGNCLQGHAGRIGGCVCRQRQACTLDVGSLECPGRCCQGLAQLARRPVTRRDKDQSPRSHTGCLVDRQKLAGLAFEITRLARLVYQRGHRVFARLERVRDEHRESVARKTGRSRQIEGFEFKVHN
jgi:hypothetical protein